MNEDECLQRFEKEASSGDPELDHPIADDIIVDALRALGWNRLADRYEDFEKNRRWFA